MAGNRYIILLVGLILSSCAQVGSITGGPKDTQAPNPITKKVSPPNGSTNFSAKEVEITFDEFFRLNEANINIRMVPAHTTIQSRVKGKKLILSWEEQLQENTTYAIYLNNAVRDITENNDTIIQYAFSTGNILDTLTYEVPVIDAWSNAPITNCLVGLFNPDTKELLSFSETNSSGWAKLSYLQASTYELLAFKDENGDLEVQDHEKVGFQASPSISFEESTRDSIPLRLFKPLQESKISSAQFFAPSSLYIGTTAPIRNETITINGKQIPKNNYTYIGIDSLRVFTQLEDTNALEVILSSDLINDTSNLRVFNKRNPPLSIAPTSKTGSFSPWEKVRFTCNDVLNSVDLSRVEIMNTLDSTFVTPQCSIELNELVFDLDSTVIGTFEFVFKDSSLVSHNGLLKEKMYTILLQPKSKYGTLHLDLSYYNNTDILLVLKKSGVVVDQFPVAQGTGNFSIEGLSPAEYSFDVVQDTNSNQQWDVGNLETRMQPEKVDHYSTSVKVRANWDIDVSLIPAQE